MGHDYLEYKNENIRLNDFNIWMLRHFLILAAQEKELAEFFKKIEWLGPSVFSGTELHKYSEGNKEKLNQLTNSLQKAKSLMEEFGEFIPLEYLQENVNLKTSYFTSKQPVKEYTKDIERLLEAISEANLLRQL